MIHLTPKLSKISQLDQEKKIQENTNIENVKKECPMDIISIGSALKRVEKGDYTVLELRKAMVEGIRCEIQQILDTRDVPISLDAYKYRKQLEPEFEVDMSSKEHEILENHYLSQIRSLIRVLETGEEFSLYNCITIPSCEPFF